MASRGSVFWVLSALTLCSKFVGGTALEARLGWDGLEFLSTTAESTHTNNVADQLPAFDESLFEWETLTSKNGAPFRVGTKKAAVTKPVHTDVYWPADRKWKQLSGDVADRTLITAVRVHDTGESKFRYELEFSVAIRFYRYFFETESGESFEYKPYIAGYNFVKYNAKNPTIVKVTFDWP